MKKRISEIRKAIKESRPLIHCITNHISANQCANGILAVGARPIMAEHPKEVSEITSTAKALLINLGSITDVRMQAMRNSINTAKEKKIPVILDAVGSNCATLRKNFVYELINTGALTVIKGNYAEINAIYNSAYTFSGIDTDASLTVEDAKKAATALSKKYGIIVLASGKTDIVTDGKYITCINNGTPMLSHITGTGCLLGALSAVYLSESRDADAIVAACAVLGICGQIAETDKGNATFLTNLIDALSVLKDEDADKYLNMEVTEIERL